MYLLTAISKAYTTLSDPGHREQYDRHGEDTSYSSTVSSDLSPEEVFQKFFKGKGKNI